VEMLKAGAHDYVMKDNLSRLPESVSRELLEADARRIRRQTERAAVFLASLVNSCGDAIVGLRLDGAVVSWNGGAERLYGYPSEDMVGASITRLMPAYRPEEMGELLARVAAGEFIEQWETVRLRKGGEPVEVSLTISPVKDHNGRTVGASVVARDNTQRKREDGERLGLIGDLTSALARANGLSEGTRLGR